MKPIFLFGAILALSSACSLSRPQANTQSEAEPAPLYPIPTQAQLDWQELETYAFVHFGLNTFNDLEWGYGNTPASTFNPKVLDVDQWVSTFKKAGLKGVILTAKHHDGFCLWPTKTTDYSVRNSPWKGGKGDLVKDLSEACRRNGLKFGLYLSPWDRHHKDYGFPAYQEAFHEQIRELTTNYGQLFEYWFDGANGGSGWYGGADSTRKIDPKTYYDYAGACQMLRKNNPNIMIFGGTEPTIRWIGNERGWAGMTNYSAYDETRASHHTQAQWGIRDAKEWLPGEVDVSIRPGWFYHHREDRQVRSVANLVKLYYQSVGRNANLLLNFPINLDGQIASEDAKNAIAWHEHIKKSFATNLLSGIVPQTSANRQGKTFEARHLTDGNTDTYWATPDSSKTASLEFKFPQKILLNNVMLQEYIRLGQRVHSFALETLSDNGQWQAVETTDSLTTIGYKRIIPFRPVRTEGLRVRITDSSAPICLSEISAYFAPQVPEIPRISRDADNRLRLSTSTDGATIRYRWTNKYGAYTDWQTYTKPITLPEEHTKVEAEVSVEGSDLKATEKQVFGYSAGKISVKGVPAIQRAKLFDYNGYTAVNFPKGVKEITFNLDREYPLRRLVYTPSQVRDASGHIQRYALYVDGKMIAEGEFSNIKNNPISVSIELPDGLRGRELRLVALKTVDDVDYLSIGDLSVE